MSVDRSIEDARRRLTAAVDASCARIERLKTMRDMMTRLNGRSDDELRALAIGIAEVIHSAPPGADRLRFVRELVERLDRGEATYEDRIIVDQCDRDMLRLVATLAASYQTR